jgi:hypothetical protein
MHCNYFRFQIVLPASISSMLTGVVPSVEKTADHTAENCIEGGD